jgi:D-3-phosphoglycerate dehydrogenase
MGEQVDARIYAYRSDEELKEVLATVDGLITGFLEIGEDILSACPNLRCISVSGVGYSNIDVEAAKRHGVTVCHIKEYCTEEVAEHALSLMMALNRNLTYYHNQLENQHLWKYDTIVGNANLSSQTLAIFGFGKIGRRVAQMARAFGMAVVAVDPYASKEDASSLGVELVSADEAFAMADIITNHMNLTAENRHFFNGAVFAKMKRQPIFINVGRGGSVDEVALVDALDKNQIRGAGLDVLEAENPDMGHCELLGRDNVILTPHSAFYSKESIAKLQTISGANMGYFFAGAHDKIFEVVR